MTQTNAAHIAIVLYAAITLWIVALCSGCIDKDAFRAEVKAAVMSPEITTAISQHVTATMRNEETSIKNEATSQPANQNNTTSAGRDAKPVSVNASIHGGSILETAVFTAGTVAVLYIVLVLARAGHRHLKKGKGT